MLYENDFYVIPDHIKRMSDTQIKKEALKAYEEMKSHPVIYKKSL